MAYQYSVALLNAKLDQIGTIIGSAAHLKVFSGTESANCAAADPSGQLMQMNLPATPFNPASGAAKTINGPWTGTVSTGGIAASWRIYDNSGTCHIQGNVGDMIFSTTNFTVNSVVQVITFTITAGNQ